MQLQLGSVTASIAFYLPTPPTLSPNWDPREDGALAQLVALNGNHWRKIITLMAKICAPDDNWRDYRDRQLLKHHELILIGARQLSPHARWHLVAGQVAADNLGLSAADGVSVSDTPGLKRVTDNQVSHSDSADGTSEQRILLTPYLDYRQYSNLLVAATRRCLDYCH